MPFVLDASVTMAWCFEDQSTAFTRRVLRSLESDSAVVPSLWGFEIANALVVASRARRLSLAEVAQFTTLVGVLPIEVEEQSPTAICERVLPLAREHGLSAYDAAYLELALRLGVRLATLDRNLGRAASDSGVQLAR